MRLRKVATSLTGSNAFIFLTILLLHGIPLSPLPIVSGDGLLYSALADRVLRGDWGGVFDSSRLLWTKSVFIAIVAAAKAVAPSGWPYLIVAMNVVCSAATGTMLASFVRRATASACAVAAAVLFYIFSFETYFWNWFVMTDALYTVFATAVFIAVASPIVDGARPRSALPLIAAMVMAILSRPPGAVLILTSLAGIVAFWPRRDGREPAPSVRRSLWITMLVVMVAIVAYRTSIVQAPQRWPTRFLAPKIEEFANREKQGEVVFGIFETPPVTYADLLEVQASRFVRYFQITSGGYSVRHQLADLAYWLPLYTFAMLAILDGRRAADERRHLVSLLLLWLVVFAYYHGITTLLWRYRGPQMPQFIMLAACGVQALQARIASRRTGTMMPSR